MEDVFILGGLRSHIGLKNGIFQCVQPELLGAKVLKHLIEKYEIDKIDEIICGNAVGTGGNITRLMTLTAGIESEVPAFTVDMQCASAMMSLDIAFSKIKSGQCDLIIAGGFESSSLQPMRTYHKNDRRYNINNPSYAVAQFSPDNNSENSMLEGAERVAKLYKIEKAELDYWVKESHRRAKNTREEKFLEDIIFPIDSNTYDEGIRDKMSQRLLDRIPSILGKGSITNAANACLINDGASFLILCSKKYLENTKKNPKAKVINSCTIGTEPQLSPTSAIKAMERLLDIEKLNYMDISAIEFNEAFAVIDVLFQRKYPELIDRYNIFGGALAYGHPYGASGAIIALHLLKALEKTNGKYGICSIAAAGGLGSALLIERV
ncbi:MULTISPECIES: thiolase family protein [unclassified Clostridioides]|uniref:thiolase family protein n=1 Tax=unclassified Clostridioides TaxID=2635829 RepID=UPI001D0C90BF|nr:acetyl-CoA C-acyltransferase [Clostridioides sp. ES-S-0001-02]MCC0639629.1 acetyl-CoA C-acyltransferase [Clostridioides sp. ES-S-0049-03]MCC0651328.1 acetyl-CoA C-acyltransferase [Clostridioides sp. ES-S-0001-03]MCC0655891.1 acetyl-CoA C-acyltransferase [Clostridioides sp. ES-S-0123-01]MCC0676444.1 acetyl-CoA C-acyltransferase [Clostridioides sp. ES-W-0018-02]MCC0680676.1 acetyl-CoA C-acyltransferase [Clostridioides sp. ES-S-0005-03]MCC0694729.1 acetyl-CoA C-acyltransferase [Clostridioides